jgi:arabinan endo-1,5-alpha-L-arabinosidase
MYYAYGTNTTVDGKLINIQVATSSDLVKWKIIGDAMPRKPVWAVTDFWAPHVIYDKVLKKYTLFYSGESVEKKTGKCLGVAFSDRPEGPFTDKGSPLLCGEGFVNIDPMAFIDPKTGKKLLYWGSGFQPIKVQELENDWTAFKPGTSAKPIVWPGKERNYTALIEGGWLDYHQGRYYLYYSGDNCCGDKANYAVMVARADNPFGPFVRFGEANGRGTSAILEKDSNWLAPGHNSIVRDSHGVSWIAYHAIAIKDKKPDLAKGRVMLIDKIVYESGWPVISSNNNLK